METIRDILNSAAKIKAVPRGLDECYKVVLPKSWCDLYLKAGQGIDLFQIPGTNDLLIRPAQNPNKTTVNDNSNLSGKEDSGNGRDDRDRGHD